MFILVCLILVIIVLKFKVVLTQSFKKASIKKPSSIVLRRVKSSSDDLCKKGLSSEECSMVSSCESLNSLEKTSSEASWDKLDDELNESESKESKVLEIQNKQIIKNVYLRNYIFILRPIKIHIFKLLNKVAIMYYCLSDLEKELLSMFMDSLLYS